MIHVLHFTNLPIFEQLQLEEALLRTRQDQWLIVNEGSPPAIVMGISGKSEECLAIDRVLQDAIPVIRRFSGGGTVVVDENTLFITWICQKEALPVELMPEPILRWTSAFYKKAFCIPGFQLQGHDYAIGDLKVGGNAQYLRQHRWLHHTTFLWDYSSERMEYLLMPKRQPEYRRQRPHHAFLARLKNHVATRDSLVQALFTELMQVFDAVAFETAPPLLTEEHRKSTEKLSEGVLSHLINHRNYVGPIPRGGKFQNSI